MIPNRTKAELLRGDIDLAADTVRIALLKAATEYDADPAAHAFVDDVLDGGPTGEELTDTNYSRQTLTGTTIDQDDPDDEAEWQADDVRFADLGGSETVEAILLYKQVGGDDSTPGDDPIIRIIDDEDVTDLEADTDGGDFEILWSDDGILGAR
jgi:hypothetical protein